MIWFRLRFRKQFPSQFLHVVGFRRYQKIIAVQTTNHHRCRTPVQNVDLVGFQRVHRLKSQRLHVIVRFIGQYGLVSRWTG